jgi:hypothetical protein
VPIHVHAPGSSAALYRRLRSRQPAPYGAFLHTQPNHLILSFSPELFFGVEDKAEIRRITTRPLKGTAPRGHTTREDDALAHWLPNDPKNRSENVMIVDLLRNDLGRLHTPPVDCGVLPGIQRRHILATRPDTKESVLFIEDLRHADAIYLSNAVRGLRSSVIDWESGR